MLSIRFIVDKMKRTKKQYWCDFGEHYADKVKTERTPYSVVSVCAPCLNKK